MTRISLDTHLIIYPMPVAVIGTVIDDRINYMPAAWIARVNFTPPMIGVAIAKTHHSGKGIHQHREFSVSFPSMGQLKYIDYCGMVSGAVVDKSKLFKSFFASCTYAPLIEDFPLTMECRLVNIVDLPMDEFFIGEIVGAFSEPQYLTNGMPDLQKMAPLLASMPDNNYWAVGEFLGKAWSEDNKKIN